MNQRVSDFNYETEITKLRQHIEHLEAQNKAIQQLLDQTGIEHSGECTLLSQVKLLIQRWQNTQANNIRLVIERNKNNDTKRPTG